MRYTVHLTLDIHESFDDLHDAALRAMDDPCGSRLMVHDNQEKRWVSGSELLLAYLNPRRRWVGA